MKPLVSAIVPACNHERYVEDAIRSLVAQTYEPLELIVIDDGSTDTTYQRIRELESELRQRFVRVVLQTQANKGSAAAISRCLELADSDAIYLLDSDDIADPLAIAHLAGFLSDPDVALAVGDNRYVDSEGLPTSRERDGRQFPTLLAYFTNHRSDFVVERDFGSYASLVQGNYVPNGWMLRRSSVIEVGGFEPGLLLDDWPLLLRLSRKYRLVFEGSVLASYRVHDRNTVAVNKSRIEIDAALVLLRERAYCRQHHLEQEWSRHAFRLFSGLTPDQLATLAGRPDLPSTTLEDQAARIGDIARLGVLESQVYGLRTEHLAHLQAVEAAHVDERSRLLRKQEEAEASHEADRQRFQREQARLSEELDRFAAQQESDRRTISSMDTQLRELKTAHADDCSRLLADKSKLTAELNAIRSSRSWRWTGAVRATVAALSRSGRRRWELAFDPLEPDPTTLGRLQLSGWVFHRDSRVSGIEISVRGQQPFAVQFGLARSDVVSAFPDINLGQPGFRALIHVLEDPVNLQVKLFLEDGRCEVMHCALVRPDVMQAEARRVYGAPESLRSSLIGLIRDFGRCGTLAFDIWQSRRIRGWMRGSGEAEALARASDRLDGSPTIVEIGSFLGCSTVLLAGPRKRRGSGRIHSIDSFAIDGDDEARPVYRAIVDSLGIPMQEAFERNLRRAGLADWVTVHAMTAEAAAKNWNTPIDLLFLDGDVSLDGSRRIFQLWSPFLRPGGTLVINGTVKRTSRAGSYRVVEEFVRPPAYEDIQRVDHITMARKT